MIFFEVEPPITYYLVLQWLFPLGGIFNILIYTRPATCVLQKRLSISWVKAFWLVVFNGGDTRDISQNEGSSEPKSQPAISQDHESAILLEYQDPAALPFPISCSLGPEANISFGDRDSVVRSLNVSSTDLGPLDEEEMQKKIHGCIIGAIDGKTVRRQGGILNTDISNYHHDIEGDHSDSLRLQSDVQFSNLSSLGAVREVEDFSALSNNHSDFGGISTADSIDKQC